MKISIVAPAYNEERRIRPFLDAYAPWFQRYGANVVELIVVANGCTDRTVDIAREYAACFPVVRVIEEPRPVGKGGAVMEGFRAATGRILGYADADGATPPEAFMELVERLEQGGADAVIASRWLPESNISPPQPLSRRISSRIFNLLVRLLFKIPVTDTQCGAKAFKREAVEAVLPKLGITQWAFDVDLLFQLRRAGRRIVEIPTEWHDISGSKVRIVRSSIEMVLALGRLRLLYSPLRWVVSLYDRTLARLVHPRPR